MERESGEDEVLMSDCLKEECAWWKTQQQLCDISGIHQQLFTLTSLLGLIADTMPVKRE